MDENGKEWDHLRGKGSVGDDLETYFESLPNGKKMFGTLKKYFSEQAGSSWLGVPAAVKVAMVKARGAEQKKYWWGAEKDREGVAAKQQYQNSLRYLSEEEFSLAISAYHAFTYESLRKMDIPYKSKDGKSVSLVRTHNPRAIAAGLTTKDGENVKKPVRGKRYKMKEGPLESCSLTNYVEVHGGQAIHYPKVPLHRVFGAYFNGRGRENKTLFLSDRENEFTVMLDDLECEYIGEVKGGDARKEPKP